MEFHKQTKSIKIRHSYSLVGGPEKGRFSVDWHHSENCR